MAKHPKAISSYLHQSAALSSLQKRCRQEAALLQKIKQQFPDTLAVHLIGFHLDCQIAILYVDSPAWASKLYYQREKLAEIVNAKELEVRVMPHKQAATSGHEKRSPRHSDKAAEVLSEAARCTSDSNLKAVLTRLSKIVRQ